MKVYQIRIKVYMLRDVKCEDILTKTAHFIDSTLSTDTLFSGLHTANKYKNYTYDMLYKAEADRSYKEGGIYHLTIRTIDSNLAKFFYETLSNSYTEDFKGLTADVKIIPNRVIDQIYSLTPIIIKGDTYWRSCMTVDEYEERLKINLIKKYNRFHNIQIDENFQLFSHIEFSNKVPIAVKYKNIKLLGDKCCMHVENNPQAQELVYMALGTGIGENNARGAGFINYKWI